MYTYNFKKNLNDLCLKINQKYLISEGEFVFIVDFFATEVPY